MTDGAPDARAGRGIGRPPWWFIVAAVVIVVAVILIVWLVPKRQQPGTMPAPRPGWTLQPVLALTGPGEGVRPRFDRPLAAAFGPDGDIYVSDSSNGRICVFTRDGRFKQEIGRLGNRSTWLRTPVGLSVDESGAVTVADLDAGVVRRFAAGGQPARSLPVPATAWRPTDVAVGPNGIFVTDETSVRRFTSGGRYAGIVPTASVGPLNHPNGVAVTSAGMLVVSDTNDSRIVSMNSTGQVLWTVNRSNGVSLPRGISLGEDGRVYVADAFGFNVTVVSPSGLVITNAGERGSKPGQLSFPNDVDVRGDLLLVTDKENDRVQVVRLIPPPQR